MKELSIEEKAKAYDKAIKVAQRFYNNSVAITKKGLEDIFPELRESEEERTRKRIIALVNSHGQGMYKDEMLAYLEKHGEQKPVFEMITPEESLGIDSDTYNKIVDECIYGEQKSVDKVEPKFRIEAGKWYICISQYCNCIEGRCYQALCDSRIIDDFRTEYDMHSDAYKYFRLWTIQDAKAGDVLEFGDHGRLVVGIVSYVNKITGKVDVNCLLEGNKFKIGNYYALDTINPHPATKEQRDALMKAMADAGYTFDFGKKELKKIEQKPQRMVSAEAKEAMYDKPAWSEEDIVAIDCAVEVLSKDLPSLAASIERLKSIKDRVLPQPQQEWSEGDKVMLDEIIDFFENGTVKLQHDLSLYASWLKSLRPQWKPSEEQMDALESAIIDSISSIQKHSLESLYNELKKLF